MLSSILLQSLVESATVKQKEQELLNENIFSSIKHIVDKIKDDHIKSRTKGFETTIGDLNVFLDVTRVSRISIVKEVNDFADRTWKNINKYRGLDNNNDKFSDEARAHRDKILKIKETRIESYDKRAKGDFREAFDSKFEDYLSVRPAELERFRTLQEKCKKIEKELLVEYDRSVALHNNLIIECQKNSDKYDDYQMAVIQWIIGDLKECAGVSAEDFRDTLDYLIDMNIKSRSQNESAQWILTEASKKEDSPDDEVDTQSADKAEEDPVDTQEDNPDDNTDDTNNDQDNNDNNDENQDDNNDDNKDDENKDDENKDSKDDDPLKDDDDFSMDSGEDGEGEDDGPPPDGLTDPDDDGSGDNVDEEQETNVVTNILQLSTLDRTLAKKKCFSDFQDLRASISSFKKVIDDNEATLDAEIRDYTIAELDKLATSVKDYMSYRFRYINYEENVQNYMVFVAALQSLIDYVKNGGEKARKLTIKPTKKKKKVPKKSKKEIAEEKADAELEQDAEEEEDIEDEAEENEEEKEEEETEDNEEKKSKKSKKKEEPEEEPEEEENEEESEEK